MDLVFLELCRIASIPKDRTQTPPPDCRGVHSNRSTDTTCNVCILEKKWGNEKHAYFHESWGKERLSYLIIYLLYFIVFLAFSQKLLTVLPRLRLIHNSM